MNGALWRLILFVSLAHALVHVYELALPSSEQLIAAEYGVTTETTGTLGMFWRVPFGVGALFTGWLVDRFGSKPLLIFYLLGCAGTAAASYAAPNLTWLFVAMFTMGCFASIYHPAGLALISRETTAANRGRALGWHGIFGSIGIATAPLIAGLAFEAERIGWRDYFLMLTVPGVVLAICLALFLREHRDEPESDTSFKPTDERFTPEPEEPAQLRLFGLLVVVGAMSGLVYGALMNFLPRYLEPVQLPGTTEPGSAGNIAAALVLICGVFGQAIAGRLAKPGKLEGLLAGVMFINVPLLLWMALAEGQMRLWATCLLGLALFMHQPVYNSLIAQYVPRRRRSLGYGFSNFICFGVGGGIGPPLAGFLLAAGGTASGNLWTYGTLAGMMGVAAAFAFVLQRETQNGERRTGEAR